MTKAGYVDSNRRVRSLQRQQDDLPLQQHSTLSLRSSLPTIGKPSSLSATPLRKLKQPIGNELPSVISISTNIDNKEKEYDKQMRLIEVCLILTE
jgi:hypothetical protein